MSVSVIVGKYICVTCVNEIHVFVSVKSLSIDSLGSTSHQILRLFIVKCQ